MSLFIFKGNADEVVMWVRTCWIDWSKVGNRFSQMSETTYAHVLNTLNMFRANVLVLWNHTWATFLAWLCSTI